MNQGNSTTNSYWQWATAWGSLWPTTLSERIPQGWLEMVGWVSTDEETDEHPINILNAHAQGLVVGDGSRPLPQQHPSANGHEIESLTHLAEQVAYVVCPVAPAPHYRKELRQALLSSHRQQAAQRRIFAHPLFEKGVVDRSLLERLEIKSPWFWQVAAGLPILVAAAVIVWHFTHRAGPPAKKVTV